MIYADRNENALGAPSHVVAAIRALGPWDFARYPAGDYDTVCAAFARTMDVTAACVACGNGADEVLSALIDAYRADAGNIVAVQPTFAWYERFAARSGMETLYVPYRRRWQPDAGDIIARCDGNTRAVILANPNNPTGELLPLSLLEAVAEALPRTTIVVDETYVGITGQSLAMETQRRRNVAIVGSMSKVPGLAGLRIGYMVSTPEIAGVVRRWLQPHPLNAAAVAATLAFLNGGDETRDFVRRYRAMVQHSLASIGNACAPIARAVYPSAGNFLLADFGPRRRFIADLFRRNGIRVRDFDDGVVDTCLRITAQRSDDTARIAAVLAQAQQEMTTHA